MWEAHSDDRWSFIKKQVFVFIGVPVSNRCRSDAVWGECQHWKTKELQQQKRGVTLFVQSDMRGRIISWGPDVNQQILVCSFAFLNYKYLPKNASESFVHKGLSMCSEPHMTWPILWAREKKTKKKATQHIGLVVDAVRTLRSHIGLTSGGKINK